MSAALGFGGRDEPRVVQARKLGRMPIISVLGEGLDCRRLAIVAEDAADGLQEDAFAIGAAAMGEEHRLLGGFAGEAIAANTLKVSALVVHQATDGVRN